METSPINGRKLAVIFMNQGKSDAILGSNRGTSFAVTGFRFHAGSAGVSACTVMDLSELVKAGEKACAPRTVVR